MNAFEEHDIFFVLVKSPITKNLSNIGRIKYIHEPMKTIKVWIFNFEMVQLLFYYISLIIPCFFIFIQERPDVIICHGGEASLLLSYFGKMLGKKVVYIETVERISSLSGTGKLLYAIADLFLVQWESLQIKYPKSKYWGRIL